MTKTTLIWIFILIQLVIPTVCADDQSIQFNNAINQMAGYLIEESSSHSLVGDCQIDSKDNLNLFVPCINVILCFSESKKGTSKICTQTNTQGQFKVGVKSDEQYFLSLNSKNLSFDKKLVGPYTPDKYIKINLFYIKY